MRLYQVLLMWVGMAALCARAVAEPVIPIGYAKPILKLEGHKDSIVAIDWSDDGKLIATASADRTVRVWDASTGKCLQVLEGRTGTLFDVDLSGDGERVVAGAADGTARVFEVKTGQMIAMFEHERHIHAVALNQNGSHVGVGSSDGGGLWIYEISSEKRLHSIAEPQSVNCIEFSPDGTEMVYCAKRLLVYARENDRSKPTIVAVDVETGATKKLFEGLASGNLAYTPDGKELYYHGDQTVHKYDRSTGQHIQITTGTGLRDHSKSFSGDRSRAAAAIGKRVIWFDLKNPKEFRPSKTLEIEFLKCVAISPDGKRIAAAAGRDGAFDGAREMRTPLPPDRSFVLIVDDSTEGPALIPSTVQDREQVIIDPGTAIALTIPPGGARPSRIDLETGNAVNSAGPVSSRIPLAISRDKQMDLFHDGKGVRLRNGKQIVRLAEGAERGAVAKFMRDEKSVLVGIKGPMDKTPRAGEMLPGLYQLGVTDGKVMREFDLEKTPITSLAVDDAKQRIVAITAAVPGKPTIPSAMRVFDATTGALLHKVGLRNGNSVAISDAHVAYVADDQQMVAFDLVAEKQLKTLEKRADVYRGIAFSEDQQQLVLYGHEAATVVNLKTNEAIRSYRFPQSNGVQFAYKQNRLFMLDIVDGAGLRFQWLDQ